MRKKSAEQMRLDEVSNDNRPAGACVECGGVDPAYQNLSENPMTRAECETAIKDQKSVHTPTPLEVTDWNGQPAIKCPRGLVALMSAGYGQTRKDDAAFIVRAVNAYEKDQDIKNELLDAAKTAWNVLAALAAGDLKGIKRDSPALQELRKAIAKAEGRS